MGVKIGRIPNAHASNCPREVSTILILFVACPNLFFFFFFFLEWSFKTIQKKNYFSIIFIWNINSVQMWKSLLLSLLWFLVCHFSWKATRVKFKWLHISAALSSILCSRVKSLKRKIVEFFICKNLQVARICILKNNNLNVIQESTKSND